MNRLLNSLAERFAGKRVAILGFGREGRATFASLCRMGQAKEIVICDRNPVNLSPVEEALMGGNYVTYLTGENYLSCLDTCDEVIKTPGIVLPKDPKAYAAKISSEMELFFAVYRKQIIGITGTKGKSTTSTLLAHVLKAAGRDVVLAGNIGIPVFLIADQVKEDTLLVLELSCHQLEFLPYSPHIGVMLNLFEEHLDHYGSMERYIHAKSQISRYMGKEDILICHRDCLPLIPHETCQVLVADYQQGNVTGERRGDVYVTPDGIGFRDVTYTVPRGKVRLIGHHNDYNMAICFAVASLLGVAKKDFTKGLTTYEPLPHRLSLVGCFSGIRFYDDSISTACETTIEAVTELPEVATVLIGGMDRGISYQPLIDFLKTFPIPHIILMEETGKRILKEIEACEDFSHPERVVYARHLPEAVDLAFALTPEGKACVLSPAAASYGIFKNFEERGDRFAALVKNHDSL